MKDGHRQLIKDREKEAAPKRDFYLDWARTSDVHVVVLVHCMKSTDMVVQCSQNN